MFFPFRIFKRTMKNTHLFFKGLKQSTLSIEHLEGVLEQDLLIRPRLLPRGAAHPRHLPREVDFTGSVAVWLSFLKSPWLPQNLTPPSKTHRAFRSFLSCKETVPLNLIAYRSKKFRTVCLSVPLHFLHIFFHFCRQKVDMGGVSPSNERVSKAKHLCSFSQVP